MDPLTMTGAWAGALLAFAAVTRLAGMGIIGGYPDGTFRPSGNVTRGQLATMLSRLLDRQ
jgi:hypothetical protein